MDEDRQASAARDNDNGFAREVLLQAEFLGHYARYLCRDRGRADDLVQDVLLKALKHRDQFEAGTNLKAWLRTIMRNTFLLGARRASREEGCAPEWMEDRLISVSDPTVIMELDDVRRAMALMPARLRDPLVLAAGGSSYDEMSCILGCAVGTVRSRLSRGRERLKGMLEDGLFSDQPFSSEPLAAMESDYACLAGAAVA